MIARLPRLGADLNRVRRIAIVLARHGFWHLVQRVGLAEYVPWVGRRASRRDPAEADANVAERLAHAFEELGPTFVKFGQLLSTRPDLVADDFIQAFSRLTDNVAPVPTDEIRALLEKRLGQPVAELFAAFDDTPLASGSVGQVHAAVLPDGREVVVKVKRPGADERARRDLRLMEGLAVLVERYLPEYRVLRPVMVVEEFAHTLEQELDFAGEGSHIARFARAVQDDPSLRTPEVHWTHTTRDTLVLGRLRATPLNRPDELARQGIAPRRLARTLARAFMRQYLVSGLFHADPHPGNLFAYDADTIGLVDFGEVGWLSEELRRKLLLTLAALDAGDVDFLVEIYSDLGVMTEETDLRAFKAEVREKLDRYFGMPAERIDVAEAFRDAIRIARQHGLLLPREFVLLAKSFITVAGVVRTLDPDFTAQEFVGPAFTEAARRNVSPKRLLRSVGLWGYRALTMLRRAPEHARDLLEKTARGNLRIIFRHDGLDPVGRRIERSVNRLTAGLILAAVTVGSSIVLAAAGNSLPMISLPWSETKAPLTVIVAGAGFLFAMAVGLWVAWVILRDRNR